MDSQLFLTDLVQQVTLLIGDFFSDAGPETHHEGNDSGEYEICLIIETAGGCVDTFCDHILVENFQDGGYEFKAIPGSNGDLIIQLSSPLQGFFTISVSDI